MARGNQVTEAYGPSGIVSVFPKPIVTTRAPVNGSDTALNGQVWIDTSGNDVYVMVNQGSQTWINSGGGSGSFSSLVVTDDATIGDGFTVSAGTTTITSDTDAAQAIYLHANGGTSETIQLHADQGTGVDSINLVSDVGGLTLKATGLASSDAINLEADAGGVDIDGALQVNISSSQAAVNALLLSASNAAGGIELNSAGNIPASIYLHADAGTSETIYIHAEQSTSVEAVHLDAEAGGIKLESALQTNIVSAEAAATAIVLSASNAAGGIEVNSSGNIAQSIYLHANGGTSETIDIHSDLGSSDTSINIHSDAGGVTLAGLDGNIKLTPGTVSAAAASATLNAKVGVVTLTGLTTVSGAQETLTITNDEVSATSGIIVQVANVGTQDARMTVEQVKPAAGSFEVMTQNNGAQALNGDIMVSFIVLN